MDEYMDVKKPSLETLYYLLSQSFFHTDLQCALRFNSNSTSSSPEDSFSHSVKNFKY